MINNFQGSLWSDSKRLRYFLIPDHQYLPDGEFILYTFKGDEKKVDSTVLTSFEITDAEAKEYLQADMNQALETAKNAFGDFMLFAAQNLHSTSEPSLVSSVLGLNPQELQNQPEIVKVAVDNLYTESQKILSAATSENPEQIAIINSRLNSLQAMLADQGISISEEMTELTSKLETILATPSFQQNLPVILAKLQNFLDENHQSPQTRGETLDSMIQSITEELLIAEEKQLDEQRQQQYKQSAQDAIAQSFQSLGIPSFAGGDLHLDTNQKEELAINLSVEANLPLNSPISELQPHLLAILNPEEIAQLHQALQVMPHYQRKQAEAIIEKVKTGIMARLGDLGSEIFTKAYNFFSEVKIVIKNLKLIQRYSVIAKRTKLLLDDLSSRNQQEDQISVEQTTFISELENILFSVNSRLQQLPTDKLEGRKELELLIEIEEFRLQLTRYEKDISTHPHNFRLS